MEHVARCNCATMNWKGGESGERGIRTLGTGLNPYNGLANHQGEFPSLEAGRGCGEAIAGVPAGVPVEPSIDPKLATLVSVWPTLPAPLRDAILKLAFEQDQP